MRISVYPNRQIELRIPSAVSPTFGRQGAAERALDNSQKLAIENLPPPEACKYPSCPWPRPGYGGVPVEREFSSYARKTIARVGGVFAPSCLGRTVFLTGTLPGSTEAAMNAISCHSAWIVHELLTRIPRFVGVLASEMRWVWVWEYQERGALHWHCIMELPTFDLATRLLDGFSDIWTSVIIGVSSRSGVDCAGRANGGTWANRPEKWQVHCDRVEGEPYKYLSKYLCKGSSFVKSEHVYPPSRWYGASRRALSDLRALTIVMYSPRGVGESDFDVSGSDLSIISLLSFDSVWQQNWVDKYGSGHTFSFAFEPEKFEEVVLFLEEVVCMDKQVSAVPKKWKPEPGSPSEYVAWPSIDRCLANPELSARLYGDIGIHYVTQLNLYRAGSRSIWGDVFWIDRHAEYLLYLRYGQKDVNSGSAPVGGLTSSASKTLGKEDWASQLSVLSTLPF